MAAIALHALVSACPLDAQVVRGSVTERGSGRTLAGVLLSILDERGGLAVEALSDENGLFELRAPAPGQYTLEAKRIGLLHDVVNPTALDNAVQRQIDLLLKAGPVAAASAKQLVARVAHEGDRGRLDADNAALIARLRVSPEGQEGLTAFLDKRKPAWIQS